MQKTGDQIQPPFSPNLVKLQVRGTDSADETSALIGELFIEFEINFLEDLQPSHISLIDRTDECDWLIHHPACSSSMCHA